MSEQSVNDLLRQEFEQVRALSNDGRLHPEKAVAWARQHKRSALHARLEWDDTVAAEAWRVEQVRGLIRVVVEAVPPSARPVRVYVSRPSDRAHGGGYQTTAEALAAARAELVNEALNTLVRLRDRYTHLPELGPLFDGVDRLVADHRTAAARQAG